MPEIQESAQNLHATLRDTSHHGGGNRLRRAGKIPAIIYGNRIDPLPVSIERQAMTKLLGDEASYTRVLTILLGNGDSEQVILKAIQRHPSQPLILHADFLRVDMARKILVRVPLHFLNEETAPGVRLEGGIASKLITDLEVRCLPGATPEYIEVDLGEMHVGDTVHISDLPLPEGIESVALSHGDAHDHPVTNILHPKGGLTDEDEDEAAGLAEPDSEADDGEDDGEAPNS